MSEETLKQFNRSGYPFQLKVEHNISISESTHNWSTVGREQPWSMLGSGFIDLVLKHNAYSTLRLVIECKRMRSDDARQLRWLFLMPDLQCEPTLLCSCFEVETGTKNNERRELRIWEDVKVEPVSLESEICVLHSDESRRQSILESLAVDLLESVEGLAEEEVRVDLSTNQTHTRLFIFPAVVTNAEIVVCRFNPASLKEDGTLDIGSLEIETVPFIRFRKSLTTRFPDGSYYTLEGANTARERSIFVVNSASLPSFLKEFKLHHKRFATMRLW
jgi:hypothetical protein